MDKPESVLFQPFWHPYGYGAVIALAPRELALIDALGAHILAEREQNRDTVAIIQSVTDASTLSVDQIARACADISDLMRPRALPAPPVPAPPPADAAVAQRQLALTLFTTRIQFTLSDAVSEQLILALWPIATSMDNSEQLPELDVAVLPAPGGWLLRVDGRIAGHAGSTAELKSLLMREVLCSLHRNRDWTLVMHASAVIADERLLVFPGRSGSGKTTLAAALVDHGAHLFSDDCVPLRADTLMACAAPGSLGIREAAVTGLRTTRLPLAGLTGVAGDLRHHSWAPHTATQPEKEVAALIFPVYDADGPETLEKLDPESRLTWLLASGSGVEALTPDNLSALLDWLASTPAWRIRYRQTATALRYIEKIIATDP